MTPAEIQAAVEFAKRVESSSGVWNLNNDRARQLARALLALAEQHSALWAVAEAAAEWRAFADRNPYGPRGDDDLWNALDALDSLSRKTHP